MEVLFRSDIVSRPQMSNLNNRVQSKQHEIYIICTGCDQMWTIVWFPNTINTENLQRN